MNRKLNEITLAIFVGMTIGVAVGVALITEFGWNQWATLVVSGFVGALSGAIVFQPKEVGHAFAQVGRLLQKRFVAAVKTMSAETTEARPFAGIKWDAAATVRAIFSVKPWRAIVLALWMAVKAVVCVLWFAVCWTVGFIADNKAVIAKWCFVMVVVATLVVVSRFTIGFAIGTIIPFEQGPKALPTSVQPWTFGTCIGIMSIFVTVVSIIAICGTKKLNPSWSMPITARISNWLGEDPYRRPEIANHNVGKGWGLKDYFALWFFMAIAPVAGVLIAVIAVVVISLDIILTLAFLLASTERLAVMAGALIGTIIGLELYLHGYHFGVIVASGVVVSFMGRWIYALRYALAHKEPDIAKVLTGQV